MWFWVWSREPYTPAVVPTSESEPLLSVESCKCTCYVSRICCACRVKRGTYIPEHGASEALSLYVLSLELGNVGGVVRDELLLRGVVRVAGDVGGVLDDARAGQGEELVRVDTRLNRAGTDLLSNLSVSSAILEVD